eukprot:TRINITY_DN7311_c2_g1_i2.p1 TRINITY_DN7311_c2_g1~~TRINITY_DN7311_c2_g1_i2.p1  ORF type:complete len:423 (+),score=102.40 TRINITY_DN7311_c2_g1_i2:172-1440(+)
MPVPLVVFAIKGAAAGGFVGAAADFVCQLVQKALAPDGAERKPISAKRMVNALALGTVIGNVGGCCVMAHRIHASAMRTVVAIVYAEMVHLPLHVSLVLGKGGHIEDSIPRVFGYTVFATAGAVLLCDVVTLTKAVNPTSLRYVGYVKDAVKCLGASTIASVLFIFSNKFADLQRNKTVLHPSGTVNGIHFFATNTGQALANVVAVNVAAVPWFALPVWWGPSMIVFPGFLYCTCLNIENGVKSAEVNGRQEMTPEHRAESQKRTSILQILPLGALPSGFVDAKKAAVLAMSFKFLAAMCASTYVAYQQAPWGKYMRCEKGVLKCLRRGASSDQWGVSWREVDGCVVLDSVAEGTAAEGDLKDVIGYELHTCNGDQINTINDWDAASAEALALDLDFNRRDAGLIAECGGAGKEEEGEDKVE